MAKRSRKKSTAPNLPQEVLDRARRQIDGDEGLTEEAPEETRRETYSDVEIVRAAPVRERRSDMAQPARYSRMNKRKEKEFDHETVVQMLANPTKFVSEEELQEEYQHVLSDLKSMGILAVGLMVCLVLLAQFI